MCKKAWRPCSTCYTTSTIRAEAYAQPRLSLTIETGEALLIAHTDALLGPPPRERTVRVMVTMPMKLKATTRS